MYCVDAVGGTWVGIVICCTFIPWTESYLKSEITHCVSYWSSAYHLRTEKSLSIQKQEHVARPQGRESRITPRAGTEWPNMPEKLSCGLLVMTSAWAGQEQGNRNLCPESVWSRQPLRAEGERSEWHRACVPSRSAKLRSFVNWTLFMLLVWSCFSLLFSLIFNKGSFENSILLWSCYGKSHLGHSFKWGVINLEETSAPSVHCSVTHHSEDMETT